MKNETFERDYTEQDADDYSFKRREADNEFYSYIITSEAVKEFDKKFKQLPRVVNLKGQQIYKDLLRDLDVLARKNGGLIRGIIDYTHWDAHIYVTLPKFEFFNEQLALLITVAQQSKGIGLAVTDDGKICLTVKIDYFEELEDAQALIDEVYNKLMNIIENEPERVKAWLKENEDRKNKRFAFLNPEENNGKN